MKSHKVEAARIELRCLIGVSILVVSALTIFALFGCAQPRDAYYFVISQSGNPYWQVIKQGIEETGTKKGITPTVVFADLAGKDNPNWFNVILSQRPKIIVFGGLPPKEEAEYIRLADREGIKVAEVNFDPTPSNEAKKANIDLAFCVLANHESVGKRAAEFVAATKKRPDPKILIIGGPPGNAFSEGRANGFKVAIKNLVPQAHVVATVYASWDRAKAEGLVKESLAANPDLDFIYAVNDGMALGASDAVQAAGKGKQIAIIGVDATLAARKAIKAGTLAATLIQVPYWMGIETCEKAADVGKGVSVEKQESVPVLLISKEVIESKKDPLLQYLR